MCFLFVSHQSNNNSWDTAFLKFDREKSKVKVTGEVKVQGHIVHPVSNLCTFSFHINQTTHSWDMSYRVFDHEKTHPKFSKKIWQKKVSSRIPQSFPVIGWVVLTLSCRQSNFCSSMPQLWPWVKVTGRSSSTFSQTYCKIANISLTKWQNLNDSCPPLAFAFAHLIEAGWRCSWSSGDRTGDAPITSEWSTI